MIHFAVIEIWVESDTLDSNAPSQLWIHEYAMYTVNAEKAKPLMGINIGQMCALSTMSTNTRKPSSNPSSLRVVIIVYQPL